MKRILTSIFLLMALSTVATPARASNWVFSPAFFYRSEETKTGTNSEVTDTLFDIRLGYLLDSSIYVGGIYARDVRDFGNAELERTSYGASVGFIKNSFAALFHYFLSSESQLDSSPAREGSGWQIDLGYYMPVGGFLLGPQLSYKKFTYNKVNGASLNPEHEETRLEPYIVFAFLF